MIRDLIAVACGGALGSMARYLIAGCTLGGMTWWGFPAGTFAVNAVGSLLIGILVRTLPTSPLQLLLVAGFCGGFTTFSAFSAETAGLLRQGCWGTAALYALLSVVVCTGFAALGFCSGNFFRH